MRSVYDLQIVDALLLPPDDDGDEEEEEEGGEAGAEAGAEDEATRGRMRRAAWRRAFLQEGAQFAHFLRFLERLAADDAAGLLADPELCALALPVCMHILHFCAASGLRSEAAEAAEAAVGVVGLVRAPDRRFFLALVMPLRSVPRSRLVRSWM